MLLKLHHINWLDLQCDLFTYVLYCNYNTKKLLYNKYILNQLYTTCIYIQICTTIYITTRYIYYTLSNILITYILYSICAVLEVLDSAVLIVMRKLIL